MGNDETTTFSPVTLCSPAIRTIINGHLRITGQPPTAWSLKTATAMICTDNFMASITIRNLDEKIKQKLRLRAAHKNCSMEEEARNILAAALAEEPAAAKNLAEAIRETFAELGGVELELPPRGPMREPPTFA